jgi:hypothetical protein
MKHIKSLLFLAYILLCASKFDSIAQTQNDSDLVQFTGFVVNYDSTKTIPFATIRISGTSRGTYSDMQGYFSFVAKRSDLLIFTCLGFEPKYYKVPTNTKGKKFKSVVAMELDTFLMEEAVIYDRPTEAQMDYMFSRQKLPISDYTIAEQNLRRKPLSEMAENLPNDGYANASWKFNDYANKAYYNGQAQPIPVLDIFAWSKFLKALENGDLKRK